MSDTATTAITHRDGAGSPPLPPTYQLLNRVRWIGYVLLGLQGVGFLIWTVILYEHFSLTYDFAAYNQAWFLIAHGKLYPYSTILSIPFWHNDGEILLYYLLAPLYWIFHSTLVLPWAQILSVVGAEAVAFTWLCDLARRHCMERDAVLFASLGLLLFLANPWLWWTISFDVHVEPLVVFFAAYMAWDMSRGKRRAWVWAVAVLLGGAADTAYILGIGLGGVLASRRTRRLGAALVTLGIAYSLFLSLVNGNKTAGHAIHEYLGFVIHPFILAQVLWHLRADIIANVAPSGLLGIVSPMIMPVAVVFVLANTLVGPSFAEPIFQSVPLYVFLPVGTVAVLVWLLPRRRRAAFVLAGVVAAQAVAWAAIWGPQTPGEWMRVSNSEAAALTSVTARIPASAEVIASQGVVGRLAERTHVYAIRAPGEKMPLKADTWFVITPTSGIELASPAATMALIGELAGPLHATLITHANGVWAFRLNPPHGVRSLTVPDGLSPLPAWAALGAAGVPALTGSVSSWHMAATGATGYVADGIEWLETPGRYLADVTLSTTSAVNVEVWNNTGNVLLARRHVLPADGIQAITLPVNATDPYRATVYSGWGPFRADFVQPPPGERLEVRVWSPGNALVNVYNADLTPLPAS